MSDPSGSKPRNKSVAAFAVPWASEEESLRRSYENICLKVNKDRPRSCSPRNTSSAVDKVSKQTGMDRYITIKRKRSPGSAVTTSEAKITKSISGKRATDQNRFAILQTEEPANEPVAARKSFKPPPIYLREATSSRLISNIISIIGENAFHVTSIKRGNISESKIQTKSENDYRKLSDKLIERKRDFYTYQLKSAKGLQVVLKGIDTCVDPKEVKDELTANGFKVKRVENVKNREKIPQPMFRVELEPGDIVLKKNQTHPIYDLRYLLYRRITVEQPHKRTGPVQCHNCQEYGHTKAYCRLPTVCVVCGEFHGTAECTKSKEDTTVRKCSNCCENHTANYRGCRVYGSLKNKMTNKIAVVPKQIHQPDPTPTNNPSDIGQPTSHPNAPNSGRTSYANTVKSKTPNLNQGTKSQNSVPPINNIETALQALIQSMNNFTATITNMMQEMMKMQNTMLQALLKK